MGFRGPCRKIMHPLGADLRGVAAEDPRRPKSGPPSSRRYIPRCSLFAVTRVHESHDAPGWSAAT